MNTKKNINIKPFIITQDGNKVIENPEKIASKSNCSINIEDINDIDSLKEIKDSLRKLSNNEEKIAIITDPHALYEPTLACLNDIRKQGINKIYSLGDNIGHGPSPSEVLSLLNEYNVKSIYGNHELYLLEGLDNFMGHFPDIESTERTKIMIEWLRNQLSNDDIESMKKYPERYELESNTGNKIVLIHTNNPYDSKGKYSIRPNISSDAFVVRGHEHYESSNDPIYTLRAVGLGQNGDDDGYATYGIIDLNSKDFHVERVNVKYNRDNLIHTINESTMPDNAKAHIKRWVLNNKKATN